MSDPVGTPRGLDRNDRVVRSALADAVLDLRSAGLPLDAPLGAYQRIAGPGGSTIELGGGPGDPEGDPDALYTEDEDLYTSRSIAKPYEPILGSTYIAITSWDRTRCPRIRTIMTYGQSPDPTSPHWRDQTARYARGELIDQPFCRKDVLRAARRTVRLRPR